MPISAASASAFNALLNAVKTAWPALHAWVITQSVGADPATRERLLRALRWTTGADAQRAFAEAVGQAVESYQISGTGRRAPVYVARALANVVASPLHPTDPQAVLLPAFDPESGLSALRAKVVARIPAKHQLRSETVGNELRQFYDHHLRPSVAGHPHFAERTLLAEIARTLQDIRAGVLTPLSEADLDDLERGYLAREAEHSRLMVTKGLSLRIRNEFVGVELRDVFVPVTFEVDGADMWTSTKGSDILGALQGGAGFDIDIANYLFEFKGKGGRHRRIRFDSAGRPEEFTHAMWSGLVVDEAVTGMKLMERVYVDPDRSTERTALEWGEHVVQTHFFPGQSDVPTLLRSSRVVVQGDPGAGKSTFAQFVHHAAASNDPGAIGDEAAACVPIRTRAAEFGEALAATPSTRFETHLLDCETTYRAALERALLSGRAIIILDGLDEVSDPGLRQDVKRTVESFVADPLYADNRLVITSRIVGYQRDGKVGAFPHVTVQPFTDAQIEACVNAWALALAPANPDRDPEAQAQDLLDAISRTPGVLRLARNPLLLTIIVLLHQQGRSLPDNRAHLYDVAVRTLLNTWPSAQRGVRLDEHFLREWLAPVAREVVSHGDAATISEAELKRLLVASMLSLKAVTDAEARDETDRLLRDVEEHTGLLVPKGTDPDGREVYGFSHLTFAEYLTAYDLSRDLDAGTLDVPELARDPDRREVLLLLAGHLGNESRHRAGALVQRLRDVDQATPLDAFLHTGTRCAAAVLADGVPVAPPDLVRHLCTHLVDCALTTPVEPLQRDLLSVLAGIATTEHADALSRIVADVVSTDEDVVRLARVVGPSHLIGRLETIVATEPNPQSTDEPLATAQALQDQAATLLLGHREVGAAHLQSLLATGWLGRRLAAVEALVGHDAGDTRRRVASLLAEADGESLHTLSLAFRQRYPDLVAARLFRAMCSHTLHADSLVWLVENRRHLPPDQSENARPPLRRIADGASGHEESQMRISATLLEPQATADREEAEDAMENADPNQARAVAIAYLRSEIDDRSAVSGWAWDEARDALLDGTARERIAAAYLFESQHLDLVRTGLRPLLQEGSIRIRLHAAEFFDPKSDEVHELCWEALESEDLDTWEIALELMEPDQEDHVRLVERFSARACSGEMDSDAAFALSLWLRTGDEAAVDALLDASDAGWAGGRVPLALLRLLRDALKGPLALDVERRLVQFLNDSALAPLALSALSLSGRPQAIGAILTRFDSLLSRCSDDADALAALYHVASSQAPPLQP